MLTPTEQAESIVHRIALKHYVTVERLRGEERNKFTYAARRAAAVELHKHGFNSVQIAKFLNRDPSTVLNMLGRIGSRSKA